MVFVDAGPLVELTYDAEGHPIALARGKVRERDADLEKVMAWLRKLQSELAPDERLAGEAR